MHQRQRRESSEAANRSQEEMEPVKPLRLSKRATWLAVHRADDSLYYKRLSRAEYLTLQALRNGKLLPDALEAGFAGSRASVATRIELVREWFANWAELGWFCKHSIRKPEFTE